MKKTLSISLLFISNLLYFVTTGQNSVIWGEDFANGIPTDWINEESNGASWEYRGANTIPNNTIGSRGACTINFMGEPLNSSSQSNGFIIFDSNYWDNDALPCVPANFGSGPVPGPHLAYLTTSSIDLSNVQYAALEWEQYVRFYQGNTRIEVSVNQGNWSLLFANNIPLASASPNSENKRIYLGNNICGNSDVRFRFVYDGLYYFWMLDDVRVVEVSANDLKINSTTYGDFDFLDPAHPTGFEWMEYSIYPTPMSPTLKFSAQIENWGGLAQTGCALNAQLYSDANNTLLYNGTTTDPITMPVGSTAEIRAGQFAMAPDTGNYTIHYSTLQNEIDALQDNNKDTAHFRISPCVLARDRGIVNAVYEGSELFWNSAFELGNVFLPTYNMPVSAIAVAIGSNADPNATIRGKIHSFNYGDSLVTEFIAETPIVSITNNQPNALGEQAKFQYLNLADTVILQANTPYWITIESTAGTNHVPIAMSHPADLYTSWIKNNEGYFFLSQIPLIRIQSCMDTGNANPDTTTYVPNIDWSQWVLFPNPAENKLFIQGVDQNHTCQVMIMDVAGREIHAGQYNPQQGINIEQLQTGCYQLIIIDENKKKVLSFIKK
jgi:hypothetical protein